VRDGATVPSLPVLASHPSGAHGNGTARGRKGTRANERMRGWHALPGVLVIHGKMPPLPSGDLPNDFFAGAFFTTFFAAGFGATFFATTFFGATFFGAAAFAAFAAFFGGARAIIERSSDRAATFDSCSAGVAGAKAELRGATQRRIEGQTDGTRARRACAASMCARTRQRRARKRRGSGTLRLESRSIYSTSGERGPIH
jgi:hypothetical protein